MLKKNEDDLSKKYGLDFQDYLNEELQARNIQDIKIAASNLDNILSANNKAYNATPGGFLRAPVHQNWVIIRQNELLSRQNEQIIAQNAAIISLLQNNTSS